MNELQNLSYCFLKSIDQLFFILYFPLFYCDKNGLIIESITY